MLSSNIMDPLKLLFSRFHHFAKPNVHFTKPILANATTNFSSSTITTLPEVSVDYLIIGGGVVGLSIAERLSRRKGKSILLVEKNSRLGEETR